MYIDKTRFQCYKRGVLRTKSNKGVKMKKEIIWKCSYCNRAGKESEIKKHEPSCKRKVSLSKVRKNDFNSLRKKATSINHFAILLSEAFTKHLGIKCEFQFYRGEFSERVPATHDAPIGKETNWNYENSSIPTHYVGWRGFVSIKIPKCSFAKQERFEELFSYACDGFGFNTGTGGGDGLSFSYDCLIFADDFPLFGLDIYELFRLKKMNLEYVKELKKLEDDRLLKIEKFIKEDKKVKELEKKCTEILKSLNAARQHARKAAIAKFPIKEANSEKVTSEELVLFEKRLFVEQPD